VTRVVTVADDLASARWVVDAAHWDDRVAAAVALHPTRTAAVTDADYAEIERLAADPRVVAVGETGLDHYWDYSPWDAQERAFRWHIDLAKRLGKPLMIHDRDAHDDVLRVLDEEGAPRPVVFHCFSGDAAMARTCVDAGYVLSFAGPVTFKNAAELRAAAALVPDGQLLVETDAPFLTPHPHRGRANEPYCLPWTVRALAHVRGKPVERVADGARRTAEAVFGLDALPPAADAPAPGARGCALDVSPEPFGDHGVSRFASDCHRPLPFCHRQAGVGPLPSRAGTVVGVLPCHTASATVPALLPRARRRSGCHVVDVSPRSPPQAGPARAKACWLSSYPGIDVPDRERTREDDPASVSSRTSTTGSPSRFPVVPGRRPRPAHRVHHGRSRPAQPCRPRAAPLWLPRPVRGRTLVRAAVVVMLTILVAAARRPWRRTKRWS
jgi:TatD DNase family protein